MTQTGGWPIFAFLLSAVSGNRGCPTLRDFRRVGTTDDGIRRWRKTRQFSSGLEGGGDDEQMSCLGPWCPPFESHERWGSLCCGGAKVGQPPEKQKKPDPQ
jgi:hypothetical protein